MRHAPEIWGPHSETDVAAGEQWCTEKWNHASTNCVSHNENTDIETVLEMDFDSRHNRTKWTTVVIVSAFFFRNILPRGFISGLALTSTSIESERSVGSACRGICDCPAAFCHLSLSWQKGDGCLLMSGRDFRLMAVSHHCISVQPLTRSVMRSERVLCVFRSEQFANSFENSVKQKELRYRISHHCFSWAADQLSYLMASHLSHCTVGEESKTCFSRKLVVFHCNGLLISFRVILTLETLCNRKSYLNHSCWAVLRARSAMSWK